MTINVRIFQATEAGQLQQTINNWLDSVPDLHIEHVTQSQVQHGQSGPMPITVCIWYMKL